MSHDQRASKITFPASVMWRCGGHGCVACSRPSSANADTTDTFKFLSGAGWADRWWPLPHPTAQASRCTAPAPSPSPTGHVCASIA